MQALKIAVDLSARRLNQAGTGKVVEELEGALLRMASSARVEFLPLFVPIERPMGSRGPRRWIATLFIDLLWGPFLLPLVAFLRGADVLLVPGGAGVVFKPIPVVQMVHDAFPLTMPGSFRAWQRIVHSKLFHIGLLRADHLIASSQWTKSELAARLPGLEAKTSVQHLGIPGTNDLESSPRTREECSKGTIILIVGTLEPRKNIVRAIEAVEFLVRRGVEIELRHAGPPGWLLEADKVFDKPWINRRGFLSPSELQLEYRSADLLLFPSLAEGFGLPVLEAMSLGCPVLCASAGSLPEVGGDCVFYCDPLDVEDISRKIEEMILDPVAVGEKAKRAVERSVRFTWDQVAQHAIDRCRATVQPVRTSSMDQRNKELSR